MLYEALSVAGQEKHKEIETPSLLLCCAAALAAKHVLLLLGSSTDLHLQQNMPPRTFFIPFLSAQKDTVFLKPDILKREW